MLDLKMIELNKNILYATTIVLFSMLFFVPLISYSEQIDDLWDVTRIQKMLTSENSFNSQSNFISGTIHYQIRDNSGGLICIVQSDNVTIHDYSQITFDYLSGHPSHSTFNNDGQIIHHVILQESWNIGEGDPFLSALRTTMFDPQDEKTIYRFFATTNGCAIQPGDKVTTIWEIIFK
tara:strand:- start:99 stop:632 length:534 start_codon:yes stop_codon:yes gene_type:complete